MIAIAITIAISNDSYCYNNSSFEISRAITRVSQGAPPPSPSMLTAIASQSGRGQCSCRYQ